MARNPFEESDESPAPASPFSTANAIREEQQIYNTEIRPQIEDAPRGNTLSTLQFIGQTDENRGVIQDTALALTHLTGSRYFDQIPPDINKMNTDIIAFQESHGLPANGEINADLLNALKAEAQTKGNQDAANALSRITSIDGFTPPSAHYDVNPLSPAQIAELNAEVAVEAGARRNGTYVEDQSSLMQTAAVAPVALNAQEAQAWAAFDKPQPAHHDVPLIPEPRPTVEQRIDQMVGAADTAPLAAELGGPQQGTITSQSTTVQAGDSPWTISKAMLEIDHQSRGLPPPTDTEIAAFNNALIQKNGIEVDDRGIANIHEGQELQLPQIIDTQGLHRKDEPAQAAAPSSPEPPAPTTPAQTAAPVTASTPTEPAQEEENSIFKGKAMEVASWLGFSSLASFGGELLKLIKDYNENTPQSAAHEQGIDVREEAVLGSLSRPVTPMAKGADRGMEVA